MSEEREEDPEGEDLSGGKFPNNKATHKVELKRNLTNKRGERTAECSDIEIHCSHKDWEGRRNWRLGNIAANRTVERQLTHNRRTLKRNRDRKQQTRQSWIFGQT
eukprot:13668433-Heterocapsa_arctica.AAC.1